MQRRSRRKYPLSGIEEDTLFLEQEGYEVSFVTGGLYRQVELVTDCGTTGYVQMKPIREPQVSLADYYFEFRETGDKFASDKESFNEYFCD